MTSTFQLTLYTKYFSHIEVSKWILVPISNESLKWLEVKKVLLLGIKNRFWKNPLHPPDLFWKQSAATVDDPLEFKWAISCKLVWMPTGADMLLAYMKKRLLNRKIPEAFHLTGVKCLVLLAVYSITCAYKVTEICATHLGCFLLHFSVISQSGKA